MISKQDAIQMLEEEGVEQNVIIHCRTVAREAVRIAKIISTRGTDVDVEFVEIASLLHDIGRAHSHGIDHGVIGASLLRAKGLPKMANVAERHIGAGITTKEASALGLPKEDMVPKTMEEKIVAHADNLVSDDEVVSLDERIKSFERKLGKTHPAIKRIRDLANEISSLM